MSRTMNGRAPRSTSHRASKAEVGTKSKAGRLAGYTIEEDPTRPNRPRAVMGLFAIRDEGDVEVAAK